VRSAVLWPREHGAWGLLAAPLLLGTAIAVRAGGNRWAAWAVMVVAASALFLVRTPLEALLGTGIVRATGAAEVSAARTRAILWSVFAAIGGALSFRFIPYRVLLGFAAIGAVSYATQWLLPRTKAQVVVAAGFAAGAPASYIALTGKTDALALLLALLAAILTVDQVLYVQLRIKTLRLGARAANLRLGLLFAAFQTFCLFALALGLERGLITWLALAGFLPLLARGYAHFLYRPQRVSLQRLGFTELAYTVFCVALVVAGVVV
jgi:hypothetical protein